MYSPGYCTSAAGARMPALCVYSVFICAAGICDGTGGTCDLASVLSFARFVRHPVLCPDNRFWAGSTMLWEVASCILGASTPKMVEKSSQLDCPSLPVVRKQYFLECAAKAGGCCFDISA
eukprot:3651166-Ditylum_brightwellii.AAC.1